MNNITSFLNQIPYLHFVDDLLEESCECRALLIEAVFHHDSHGGQARGLTGGRGRVGARIRGHVHFSGLEMAGENFLVVNSPVSWYNFHSINPTRIFFGNNNRLLCRQM